MFNKFSPQKNEYMLTGSFRRRGYDWWWHSFTGVSERTGERKSFFIEFFICNPALAGREPVFGTQPDGRAKGARPSYLMVKAGCWGRDARQLHRFFSLQNVQIHGSRPFSVSAEDCFVSDRRLCGSVCVSPQQAAEHPERMSDAGEMSWQLALDKRVAFDVGYGTGRVLRALKAFEMYWHAAGMKTLYSGTVTLGGERYLVEPQTSFGYADKNWGRGFTSPWVWLSSCDLTSAKTGKRLENSVFDIGGGRPKIYFAALGRKLLGAYYYEGEEFEFNFSKFWRPCHTDFACGETEDEVVWKVRQTSRTAVAETELHCPKNEMLLVRYQAPDGTRRHNRLWNGGTGFGTLRLYRRVHGALQPVDELQVRSAGCEWGEYGR